MQIRLFPNPDALAIGAAAHIRTLAQGCIADHGQFSLALSGGSTPMHAYRQLAAQNHEQELDWTKVQIFWGDERCVPLDHEQSNCRMAHEALLEHVPIPPENIHCMACEDDPTISAREYEAILRAHFPAQELPQFDLILLGLGEDGHTASLFPGSDILNEQELWVAPSYAAHLDSWRVSLTLPVINAATNVMFLVSGESKSRILNEIIKPVSAQEYPAQRIDPQGELTWFIDRAAGKSLEALK